MSQSNTDSNVTPIKAPLRVDLSVFTNDLTNLTKTIMYRNGKLKKGKVGVLSVGSYEKRSVGSLQDLDNLLDSLNTNQATSYGVAGVDAAPVRTLKTVSEKPGAITRTKKEFHWSGPGVFMIDYDPPEGGRALTPDELHETIISAMPELENVSMLWRPSASSCIWDAKTDERLVGLSGQRLYFFASEGGEIPYIGQVLFDRLWLAGHGHIFITKSGTMLPRTIVDKAVWQPERLDFASGAVCKGSLQRILVPSIFYPGVESFNVTSLDVPTTADMEDVKKLVRAAESAVSDQQKEVRSAYIESRVDEVLKDNPKAKRSEVRQTMRMAAENRFLTSDFMLETQRFGVVSVADILGDRIKYHKARTKDPLEPDYHGGAFNTVVHLDGTKPHLYAFAHGGCRYDLRLQTRDVDISPGTFHEVVDTFGDILINEPDLFCNDLGIIMVDQSITGMPRQQLANAATLTMRISASATCHAYNAKGARVERDPPDKALNTISNRKDRFGMRELADVISAPTLRRDGSILQVPGYDNATQLLLMMDEAAPDIPAHPTREDAVAALRVLWEPVSLFDYATPLDRAVMLAGMLTAVVRRSLPTAPGMLMSGSVAGSGKTKLAQIISLLAGGGTAVTAFTKEKEEQRKNVSSVLLSGDASLIYDNVTGTIVSDLLCALLSSEFHSDRILGQKDKYILSTRLMLLLSGNNVVIGGDLGRRVMSVYLSPQCESPWSRSFKFDPVKMIQRDRLKYITAAITILRAYISAGRPDMVDTHTGSFEEWSKLVRQSVIWMGEADPQGKLVENFDEDPDTDTLREVLRAWFEAHGNAVIPAAEISHLMNRTDLEVIGAVPENVALRNAILAAVSDRKQTNKVVGQWLGYNKNRIVGGLMLEHLPKKRSWRVKQVEIA